jgi:hypothetical protein
VVTVNKKEHVKLSNQSLTFEVFGDNEKLTVTEILERVNEKLKPKNERIADSTLRRALEDLVDKGFLQTYGRQRNATLYGKQGATFDDGGQRLIPFAGELKSVEDFLRIVSDPNRKPLSKNADLLAEKVQHTIRRKLASVVVSSMNPGYDESVKGLNRELHVVAESLRFTLNIIDSFLNSPVWYKQYRDQIAYAMRQLQEKDPELFQLVFDYIRSEG